jgi:hypothetical protein
MRSAFNLVPLASVALLGLAACGGSSNKANGTQGTGGSHVPSTSSAASSTSSASSASSSASSATSASSSAGSGSSSSSGGMGGAPSAVPPPQVVNIGGSVLATPKVQLIGWMSDPLMADVDKFVTDYGASGWATQTSEYGVGAFTKLPTILISTPAPASFNDDGVPSQFQQMLASNLTGASPAWGAADPNTIYAFVLPAGTNITSAGNCCTDFYGYHYEASVGSINVPYAVSCNCAGGMVTALENMTTTLNHELVEAATNPFTDSNPAFGQTDDADAIWTIATGGEIADMCQDNNDMNAPLPGTTYFFQRTWSNAAAKALKNPCVPAPTGAYFNAYSTVAEPITLNYGGAWPTKGVKIPVGQMRTIEIVLASDGPTGGPWKVTAWDLNGYLGANAPNTVVTLDKTSGVAGDVLHLTIKVNSYDPSFGGAGFVLESTLNGQDNLSFGAIGM